MMLALKLMSSSLPLLVLHHLFFLSSLLSTLPPIFFVLFKLPSHFPSTILLSSYLLLVSTMGTTQWLQCDQILPLSWEGCGLQDHMLTTRITVASIRNTCSRFWCSEVYIALRVALKYFHLLFSSLSSLSLMVGHVLLTPLSSPLLSAPLCCIHCTAQTD